MSNETPNGGAPTEKRKSAIFKDRKKVFLVLSGVLVVLMAVFGYPLYVQIMTHESTEDAFVEAQIVSIGLRVAGHVDRVLVDDNQKVREGDLLAEVDDRDYKVALGIAKARQESAVASKEEAEAHVLIAQNNLAQKKASLNSYMAAMAQTKAGIAEYEASNNRDKSDLERMKKIAEVVAVSRHEYDHALAQASVSRAKLNSARKEVDTRSAGIAQARASVNAAENELRQAHSLVAIRTAELREAEAEVERAELNLSYTRVTAPCDGYVTKKSVEPGAYVQVGQKILSIVRPDVWVVANFKETQISDMRPGQPVEIEVDAYPDVIFRGHVDSFQRGTGSRFTLLPPENATGNFIKVVQRVPVKIVLDASDDTSGYMLAPGMSVIPNVNIAPEETQPLSAQSDKAPATAIQ